jgi:hypothetical protein
MGKEVLSARKLNSFGAVGQAVLEHPFGGIEDYIF